MEPPEKKAKSNEGNPLRSNLEICTITSFWDNNFKYDVMIDKIIFANALKDNLKDSQCFAAIVITNVSCDINDVVQKQLFMMFMCCFGSSNARNGWFRSGNTNPEVSKP